MAAGPGLRSLMHKKPGSSNTAIPMCGATRAASLIGTQPAIPRGDRCSVTGGAQLALSRHREGHTKLGQVVAAFVRELTAHCPCQFTRHG